MTRSTSDIFAARFAEAIRVDGRTQEQFARDTGFTLRTVQRWRHGHSLPTGKALLEIAAAFGREPSWFYAEDPNGDTVAA